MSIIDFSNIFLISLWKLNVKEVINNKNYDLPKEIIKVALTLPDYPLSQQEEDLLELHDWLVIEVEPSLIDANAEQLETYLRSHFEEINRLIDESDIIHPPEEEETIPTKNDDDDSIDSLLNSL